MKMNDSTARRYRRATALMQNQKLTQTSAARRVGLNPSYFSKLRKHFPPAPASPSAPAPVGSRAGRNVAVPIRESDDDEVRMTFRGSPAAMARLLKRLGGG